MNSNSFWFCPECKIEVNDRHITYAELHETCGCPVFVVNTSKIATTVEQLVSDLEELEEYRKLGFKYRTSNIHIVPPSKMSSPGRPPKQY